MSNRRLLSTLTRAALTHTSGDYVSRDHDDQEFISDLKLQYGLEKVYRFDIGKNTDGFSPRIREILRNSELHRTLATHYMEYPDNQHKQFRARLGELFGLPPEMFLLSAGLESVIDHIVRACLNYYDSYLIPMPNFSVFEDMSTKISPNAIRVPLTNDLRWTTETTELIFNAVERKRPKLIWISNPINPTGQFIAPAHLERIIHCAGIYGTLVVIDEAYGEYTDGPSGPRSSACFVRDNPQLMVLRTFSKLYGLPSARVGYMICSNPELREAVKYYRPMFPFSWLSLYLADLALNDRDYLEESRRKLAHRKKKFIAEMERLPDFELLNSDVNTIMLRHRDMGADELSHALNRKGIITANLNKVRGICDRQFLRMTVRNNQENMVFANACCSLIHKQTPNTPH